jgi:hypothetical protein
MLLFCEKAGLCIERIEQNQGRFEILTAVNNEIWRHIFWKTSTNITKGFTPSIFGVPLKYLLVPILQ